MRVTITRPVTKRCPFKDELDLGELTMTFEGVAPELHELAAHVDEFRGRKISHEDYTQVLSEAYPEAIIETTWHTGPWTVRVNAVLRESLDTAGA